MTTAQTILLAITGNTLVLAVLGWLARSLIQNLLAKDLDEHRIRLEAENQRAAQAFEHELAIAAKEHDIRFGKLHERRADVIATLYKLLTETSEKGAEYASPYGFSDDPPKTEKFQSFAKSFNEAAKFFYGNKLFLPEKTCEKVEELFKGIKEHPGRMHLFMNMADTHSNTDLQVKKDDAWAEAWRFFKEDLKPAMTALEQDLRLLLGDESYHAS